VQKLKHKQPCQPQSETSMCKINDSLIDKNLKVTLLTKAHENWDSKTQLSN